MNSHIINPFKAGTQFTLQIHLIIDLITFKETMVFSSTGMQYSFYSPLPTFIGFLQKLVLQGLGNAWRCLTSPHLSVRAPPATTDSFSLMRKSLLAGLPGKREKMNMMGCTEWAPSAQTPLRWQPWASQPTAPWGNSFQPSSWARTAWSPQVSLLQRQPQRREENFSFLSIWYNKLSSSGTVNISR